MKKILQVAIMSLVLVCLFFTCLIAQDSSVVDTIIISNPEPLTFDFLDMKYTLYFSLAVTVLGFFQKFLPDWITLNVAARVLAIAIAVGIAAVQFGFIEYWEIYLGWIIAALGYNFGLKPAGIETPKSAKQAELKTV